MTDETRQSVERLAVVVRSMYGANRSACHHAAAAWHVAGELPAGPAADEARRRIEAMCAACRAWCVAYDNLRSAMGTLERESGVANPTFYIAPMNDTGTPNKCEHCRMLSQPANLPAPSAASVPLRSPHASGQIRPLAP